MSCQSCHLCRPPFRPLVTPHRPASHNCHIALPSGVQNQEALSGGVHANEILGAHTRVGWTMYRSGLVSLTHPVSQGQDGVNTRVQQHIGQPRRFHEQCVTTNMGRETIQIPQNDIFLSRIFGGTCLCQGLRQMELNQDPLGFNRPWAVYPDGSFL